MNLLRPEAPPGRCMGYSTAIALKAIADAIASPGRRIPLVDHHDGWRAMEHLAHMAKDYIEMLQLRFIRVEGRNGKFFGLSGFPC